MVKGREEEGRGGVNRGGCAGKLKRETHKELFMVASAVEEVRGGGDQREQWK